jgi:excisionase family DNA binding protein
MSTSAQYITVRETAQILGTTEKKIMDLVENKELQAYRIAGQFLRLKKADVMNMQNTGTIVNETVQYKYTSAERVRDFFYYNDFYLISAGIIIILLYVIFYI